jgi:hypothetical protein
MIFPWPGRNMDFIGNWKKVDKFVLESQQTYSFQKFVIEIKEEI